MGMEENDSETFNEVAHRLNATSEAVALLADGGSLSISAPEDLLALLDALQVGGQPLEPTGLVGLATFVESVDAVCAAVRRLRATMPAASERACASSRADSSCTCCSSAVARLASSTDFSIVALRSSSALSSGFHAKRFNASSSTKKVPMVQKNRPGSARTRLFTAQFLSRVYAPPVGRRVVPRLQEPYFKKMTSRPNTSARIVAPSSRNKGRFAAAVILSAALG